MDEETRALLLRGTMALEAFTEALREMTAELRTAREEAKGNTDVIEAAIRGEAKVERE
jgi:hypothetical protein